MLSVAFFSFAVWVADGLRKKHPCVVEKKTFFCQVQRVSMELPLTKKLPLIIIIIIISLCPTQRERRLRRHKEDISAHDVQEEDTRRPVSCSLKHPLIKQDHGPSDCRSPVDDEGRNN